MNELKTSTCSLQLAKVPFNFEDNFILEGGAYAHAYFISKSGFTFSKVQFGKFENKMKYVLRLDDNYNAQFNQISFSNSYNSASALTYFRLFNYAIFTLSSTYKKQGQADETSTGIFLYFVNGVKWLSPQTIELDLKMDTLNTLYIANNYGSTRLVYHHIFEY